MSLNGFCKQIQAQSAELCNRWDRDHGLWILPLILIITIGTIPFMFIEMLTFQPPKVECRHRIDNRRANYRVDPYCVICNKPLCTARNANGASCMLQRNHNGGHHNPYFTSWSDWVEPSSLLK